MYYIYKIKNIINNKFYIGSTNDYKRRWNQHRTELNNNKHVNNYLQNSWNKYGMDNFKFNILEKGENNSNQYIREQYYLNKLNPFDKSIGYNISFTAYGGGTYGSNIHTSKYTEEQIIEVKKILCNLKKDKKLKDFLMDIYKKTKVNPRTINRILKLESWVKTGEKYNEKIRENFPKKTKWNDRYIPIIISLYKQEIKAENISKKLDINIRKIQEEIRWYKIKEKGNLGYCNICNKRINKKSSKTKYCKKCAREIQKKNKLKYWNKNKKYIKGLQSVWENRSQKCICIDTNKIYNSLSEASLYTGYNRPQIQKSFKEKHTYNNFKNESLIFRPYEKLKEGCKLCSICGNNFKPKNNKQKYCKRCKNKIKYDKKNIKVNYKKSKTKEKTVKNNKKASNINIFKKEKRIKILNKNKEYIINLYLKENQCITNISKIISNDEIKLYNKDIKEFLINLNIYDSNKKNNKQKFDKQYIDYNGVFNIHNKIIKVFKYKWQCRDWMVKNKIAISDSNAKNILYKIKKENNTYKGYIFKEITKEYYDKYKEDNE